MTWMRPCFNSVKVHTEWVKIPEAVRLLRLLASAEITIEKARFLQALPPDQYKWHPRLGVETEFSIGGMREVDGHLVEDQGVMVQLHTSVQGVLEPYEQVDYSLTTVWDAGSTQWSVASTALVHLGMGTTNWRTVIHWSGHSSTAVTFEELEDVFPQVLDDLARVLAERTPKQWLTQLLL